MIDGVLRLTTITFSVVVIARSNKAANILAFFHNFQRHGISHVYHCNCLVVIFLPSAIFGMYNGFEHWGSCSYPPQLHNSSLYIKCSAISKPLVAIAYSKNARLFSADDKYTGKAADVVKDIKDTGDLSLNRMTAHHIKYSSKNAMENIICDSTGML
ncbi:hypothetical protein DICVIV_06476 [Dictyocaulus viviparus]|uniref:Uncharacterized protein n=1 Tax=Dictyocaulus viviparus TaxID=29172 RepID=A0A0D8XSD9_DICVI|nr:hypothetical protein DICVIV_06476 [Dictyocaulus viviparus]